MFDPAVIGTTILWRSSERQSESELERRGREVPVSGRKDGSRVGRTLAVWLRSVADRLEPAVRSDITNA